MSLEPPPIPPSPAPLSPERTGAGSVHISLTFLALAFSVFLLAQIRAIGEQQTLLQWQIKNAETQNNSLKAAERQLHDLSVQREPMVKQSTQIQASFQSLLNDVLELSKDDKDAREVVETWKIQRAPNSPAATAAPAAAAAPNAPQP